MSYPQASQQPSRARAQRRSAASGAGACLRVAGALALALWLIAAGLALPVQAQGRKGSSETIEMNFKNVDIVSFLNIMSLALELPLVWDETKVRGSITLVSPKKFNRDDALRIFETVLEMHGYTTIRSVDSPLVQVVPAADAPRLPSPTRGREGERQEASFFVTQIIPLKYADANQVRAAVTPLVSKSAGLAIYAPGNVLVLSDTESNVRRMQEIIREMDVPPGDVEFVVIALRNASASKMAPLLTQLSSALPSEGATPQPAARGRRAVPAQAGGTDLKVVADERTNTLILVGDPLVMSQFREIIATLDVPGAVDERGVRVFRLEHADATELVKILKDVNLRETPKEGQPQAQAAAAAVSGQLGRITLTADKATNALIVFGPAELIATMGDMVKALDLRRPQVFVEVLIMEMTLEKSLQLGVRWQATTPVNSGVAGIGVPSAAPQTLEAALASGSGSAVGVVGDEINFAGQKFTSFSGFIQASQQDQDLNVLANPQILTLNNQEAEINVSQVVPVSTRTVTNQNLQTTTEYEFKDVGIILKITPQITGEDKVRLLINQESSSIATRQDVQNTTQQAITTLKRKINTQVVVDDNTTMAIGGLIQDQVVNTETKVPLLGDIPILGALFRSSSDETRKINLVVFIRPRIILTPDDLQAHARQSQERFDAVRTGADAEAMMRHNFQLAPQPLPAASEEQLEEVRRQQEQLQEQEEQLKQRIQEQDEQRRQELLELERKRKEQQEQQQQQQPRPQPQ
jgi:general secretion pathway protein D